MPVMILKSVLRNFSNHLLSRQLFIIFSSLLISYGFWFALAEKATNLSTMNSTLFATLLASVIGISLSHSFTRYPGTESYSVTLSSITLSYSLTMAILLIARIDYARGLLFGNFALTIVMLLSQQSSWPSRRRMRVGMIEGHSSTGMPDNLVDIVPITQPTELPALIDAIAVDLRREISEEWQRYIVEMALSDIPIFHIKHLKEALTGRVELEHLSETSYGALTPPSGYLFIKRFFDFLISLLVILLSWPIMIIICIAIRLESPGPALYRQRRMGFKGRIFVLNKFRSMHVSLDSPDPLDAAVTKEGDVRITNVGAFLRKTRLDELPQLFNVLCGDMSLIGPRPEAEILSNYYQAEIPFYRYRHVVLPGLTGWAQVNQGHVTDVRDVSDKLNFDFYYIKNLSPWLDSLIAVRTLIVMITGKGAR